MLTHMDMETLFRLQIEKQTKRFMIFDPKKGGALFFLPPPPPQHASKPPKSGIQVGGFGGIGTENSLGNAFIGQKNDFARG